LRREVGAATGLAPQKAGKETTPPKGPYRRIPLGDGWEVLVGTSAAGNAAVTFDVAVADDLWLHARGVPGAHVILRTNAATPPDEIVERAAQVAAFHSAAQNSTSVDVDVALRRHVKKIPNAPPGLVRYANERTLRVTPRP
jgi:predicted ribosome quality control (RQC) complex YloA/Tae2 family protein